MDEVPVYLHCLPQLLAGTMGTLSGFRLSVGSIRLETLMGKHRSH